MVPHRSHAGIPSDEPATRGQGEAGGGDVHHHSSVSFAPGVPGQADGGDGGSYGDEGQWEGAPEAYEAGPSAAAEAAARTAPASSSHRPPGRHRQRPAGHSGGGGDAAGGSKRGQHARRAAEARARLDALSPIREGSREGGDSYAASPVRGRCLGGRWVAGVAPGHVALQHRRAGVHAPQGPSPRPLLRCHHLVRLLVLVLVLLVCPPLSAWVHGTRLQARCIS